MPLFSPPAPLAVPEEKVQPDTVPAEQRPSGAAVSTPGRVNLAPATLIGTQNESRVSSDTE